MFCAVLCITGVILVVQPEFLFNRRSIQQHGNTVEHFKSENISENAIRNENEKEDVDTNIMYAVLGVLLPMISGTVQSAQAVLVKKYPFIKEDVVVTGFWTMFFCSVISALLMGIFEKPTIPNNCLDILYISGHSF